MHRVHRTLSNTRAKYATRAQHARADKGFTLIELLVVVVILGVLIAVAIPLYLNYRRGANDSAAQTDVRNTISVLEVCRTSDGTYPVQTSPVIFSTTTPVPPCSGQSATLSNGTSIKYSSGGGSYILVGTNSGGTPKYYCYNSFNAGSVVGVAAANLAAATC